MSNAAPGKKPPAARKGLGLSADMMAPDPAAPPPDARTTQTTTMPRAFYYGVVVPYLAKRAEAGLPSTWNWLSVEAVRRFIEEDDGAAAPVPEAAHTKDRRFATLEHDGVTRTVSEWSRLHGIPRRKILDRMARGMPSAQVLGLEAAPSRARVLTVNGEPGTIAHWAARYPVNADRIKYRLGRGWSDEDAVLTPPGMPRGTRAPADA